MLRTFTRAVAVLVALGVVAAARPASAQEGAEEDSTLAESHRRLEEMKVDLALLADTATFPYYIGCCVEGNEVELRGFVPSEAVKQRAFDLAQRTTYLRVRNALKVQPKMPSPAPLRSPQVLQQDAAELLVNHFGEARRRIGLQARPDGQIVIKGPIDSMETKLAVSRLFRQLPGCYGVVNELIVQETLHDGKRVAPVTNGSLMVPISALDPKTTLPPPPRVEASSASDTPPPASKEIAARSNDLSLPPSATRRSEQSTYSEKNAHGVDALATPALPKSWSQPAMTEESEITPRTAMAAPKASDAMSSKPQPAAPSTVQPMWVTKQAIPVTEKSHDESGSVSSSPGSAPTKDATSNMTWQRPNTAEESESKTTPSYSSATPVEANPAPTPAAPVARTVPSSRRWPPAYETKPAAARNGQTGVIVFDDLPRPPAAQNGKQGEIIFDDPPQNSTAQNGKQGEIVFDDDPPKPAQPSAATGNKTPFMGSFLQRQIQERCGKQVGEIHVETQRDGSINIRVKVSTNAAADKLSGIILAIPGMSSPNVHLTMDVGP